MIRLETYEPMSDPWGSRAAEWWRNVRTAITYNGMYPIPEEWDNFAKRWGGQWEYGWSVDGARTLFPEALVFEDERAAVVFLLRWA